MIARIWKLKGYSLLELLASLAVSAVLLSVLSALLVVGQSRTVSELETVSKVNELQSWFSRMRAELMLAKSVRSTEQEWELLFEYWCDERGLLEKLIHYKVELSAEGSWQLTRLVREGAATNLEDVERLTFPVRFPYDQIPLLPATGLPGTPHRFDLAPRLSGVVQRTSGRNYPYLE